MVSVPYLHAHSLRGSRARTWAVLVALLVWSGCSDDEDGGNSGPVTCDPDAPSCENGLICVEQEQGGALCQIPPGGACDPKREEPACRVGSECLPNAEAETDENAASHVCLVVEAGVCDPIEPHCAASLTCAEIEGGNEHRCFAPLLVRGAVTDSLTGSAIGGAHVIALDDEGIATTDVATSNPDGSYELEIPIARNEEGEPASGNFTLRTAAQHYQVFPGGLRTALPLSTTDAAMEEEAWVIEGAPTAVTLIPLEGDHARRHVVSGHLGAEEADDDPDVRAALAGVLIVAAGPATQSALTDRSGNFTLFNIEDGEYTLKGYAAGVKVMPIDLTVHGSDVDEVALAAELANLATVTGSVQLVNAPGGAMTSVILVVDDTFDDAFVRGDVPRGLRAPKNGEPNVTGGFTIEDVPEGRYVVLAAFENDALVRDPDTNIAGTDLVRITVGAADMSLSESFKVTEALAVIAPGADGPEAVSEPPLLTWADDSSEDWYDVVVYDAFGEEVWRADKVPSGKGSSNVTLRYAGPLEVGMYYQFRVTSWRSPGGRNPAPISATEDLRGVFYVTP